MRASLIAILTALIAASLLLPACDRDDRDSGEEITDEQRSESDDVDGEDDERSNFVADGGDIELSVDDVVAAVERFRLLAPGVEEGNIPDEAPAWMSNPQARSSVVRDLVRFQVIRLGAAHRDIEIDAADKTALISDHDQLQRYLPLFQNGDDSDELHEELATVGLDIDDVRHLAHIKILEQKLEDALAEEFSDDQLWAIYQEAHDKADIVAVRLRNTPTSDEIDRAMSQYDEEIRAYFRDNRERYRTQPRVHATVLVADDDEAAEAIADAAQRLEEGDEPETIAQELGLELSTGVNLRRSENQEGYHSDVGATGFLSDSRRGPYAWRIDERQESEPRSLDRPLRREIASQIMREEEGITPSNRQRAEEARTILNDGVTGEALEADEIEALKAQLEEAGFEPIHTEHFSLHSSNPIPEVGLAREVSQALGDADLDDPVIEPTLERNAIYVARLVDRVHPDRETFDEDVDEFREGFLERNRDRLVDQYAHEYQSRYDVRFNLAVLDEHFGEVEHQKQPPTAHPGPPEAQ